MGIFKEILDQSKITFDPLNAPITIIELINYLDIVSEMKFKNYCLDSNGEKKYYILIFIDGTEISALQNLESVVNENSEVTFLPSIHGG